MHLASTEGTHVRRRSRLVAWPHRLADLGQPLGRRATAQGSAELDAESREGRLVEADYDERRRVPGLDLVAHGLERRRTGVVVSGVGGTFGAGFVGHAATVLRAAVEIGNIRCQFLESLRFAFPVL